MYQVCNFLFSILHIIIYNSTPTLLVFTKHFKLSVKNIYKGHKFHDAPKALLIVVLLNLTPLASTQFCGLMSSANCSGTS